MKLFCTLDHDKFNSEAYRTGWIEGQSRGIHLQGEFTRVFFSKIRFNPQTLVYEIPQESYDVLKLQMSSTPKNKGDCK